MIEKTVLLVIDMQLVAFDGVVTAPINKGNDVVDAVAELVNKCRRSNVDVLYIQTSAISGQPYAKDVHGWEIHPRLEPKPQEPVVFKAISSGFDGTDLQTVLQRMKAKRLIVCGIWSQYCVANTAKDAAELGYKICVANDAHGTVAADDTSAQKIVDQQNQMFIEQGFEVKPVADLS